MSLKAFHLVFITAASALACGFGVWAFQNYAGADGRTADLLTGLGAVVVSLGLLGYERYFLKKNRHVGYL
jgi:hypothetical protein